MLLIYIALMTNDHVFTWLLAMHRAFLVKDLFKYFAHFYWVVYYLLSYENSFVHSGYMPLLDMDFEVFSSSLWFVFLFSFFFF